jgi:hypothetical protein
MTFSAGSRRNTSRRQRRRSASVVPQSAPTRRATTARSARTTVPTRTAKATAPRARRSPQARSFQGKLQPMVLPSDLPQWLRSLMQVQRGIWVGTIVLSTVALGTYGWSVYSQQQWGMAYNQLQRLQRNERQLISGNEMMKNQIAQQVDPKSLGLAPQKSNDVIFIKPDPAAPKTPAVPLGTPTSANPNQSFGY